MMPFRYKQSGSNAVEMEKLRAAVDRSAFKLSSLLSQDCPLPSVVSDAFHDLLVRFDHLVRFLEANPPSPEPVADNPSLRATRGI
jgi:hypothetical protein